MLHWLIPLLVPNTPEYEELAFRILPVAIKI